VRELLEAAMYLAGLGAMNHLDGYLTKPPVKREGRELVATFEVSGVGAVLGGTAAVGAALLVPAVGKVREAATRMQGSNNLKMIGLGMLNFEAANGRFPSPIGQNFGPPMPNPKPLLSWRVHLLPYFEQADLYNQFKMDEPWDSPNNKKLIERMPKIYASPAAPLGPGMTYYKVFVGGGAMFDTAGPTRITGVTDGLTNTIMAVEGGLPVIWTKPDDVQFDPKRALPDLSLAGNRRIQVLMGDGSVRSVDLDRVSPEALKAAITANGGETIPLDEDGPMRAIPKLPPKGGVPPPKGAKVVEYPEK